MYGMSQAHESMEGGGRAKHDSREGGGRAKQEARAEKARAEDAQERLAPKAQIRLDEGMQREEPWTTHPTGNADAFLR
jgi:hypothetical protein